MEGVGVGGSDGEVVRFWRVGVFLVVGHWLGAWLGGEEEMSTAE